MKKGSDDGNQNSPFFENLIDKKALASLIGMSIAFINDWMPKGLPYHKVGSRVRFRLSEVETWLERRRVNG